MEIYIYIGFAFLAACFSINYYLQHQLLKNMDKKIDDIKLLALVKAANVYKVSFLYTSSGYTHSKTLLEKYRKLNNN